MRKLVDAAIQTPTGWRLKNAGSLTTLGVAHVGVWHRDVGEGLFGDEALELSLPDYYFASLLPLDELTVEQGTNLVLGMHRLGARELRAALADGRARRVIAAAMPGDLLLMNGKVVHRGMPNPMGKPNRSLLYDVYTAKWFEQGRDATREVYTGGGAR